MNSIIIAGRLTRDPELKTTNSGTEVCNIAVAVDRFAKKGEEKKADFIDCTVWGKSGVFVNTYFKKGDGIVIRGRLESRKWKDNDGNNRTSWEVVAENVEFAQGKGSGNSAGVDTQLADLGDIEDENLPF